MASPFDDLLKGGEVIGDIDEIFFTNKEGERIVHKAQVVENHSPNIADDVERRVMEQLKQYNGQNLNQQRYYEEVNATNNPPSNNQTQQINKQPQQYQKIQNNEAKTIIHISKEVLGTENDMEFPLTALEEKRLNTFSPRNREFIDIDTGEVVTIVEKTEMYNGAFLYTIKKENGKLITYPRSMFIGRQKKFVPKEFYIREAVRAIEDTLDESYMKLISQFKQSDNFIETDDGEFLELVLDEPLSIKGGFKIPDKIPIDVLRMYDLDYKILMLKQVICLNNKIASLVFEDLWF